MWGQQPRSIRTNNPGAINFGSFAQKHGATGTDGRLAIFPDVETGRKAMSSLLDTYERQHGLKSVAGIIGRWAPRGVDNNSTDLYIKTVAAKLGVDPNAPLTAQHRPGLMDAMSAYEAGTSNIPQAVQPSSIPTSTPEPQPMADEGWSLSRALNGPMFQSGLGGFLAAARGGDVNEGMHAGAQRAAAIQRGQTMEEEQARRKRLEAAFGAGNFAGVPPEIANIAKLLGADHGGNLIAKSLMDRMQAEQGLNTQKQLIDYRNQAEANDPYRKAQIDQARAHTKLYEAQANSKQDPAAAFNTREQIADRLGLVGEARKSFIATGKMGREMDATSLKYIYQAQDEMPGLDSAISQIEEAKGLVPQSYSRGVAPVTFSKLNQALPDWAPDILTDREKAKATLRYDQLMSQQSVEAMSAALKGATTDTELKLFKDMMADPRTPVENKIKMLDGMLTKAKRHREILGARIEELGGKRPSSGAATRGGNVSGAGRDSDPFGLR